MDVGKEGRIEIGLRWHLEKKQLSVAAPVNRVSLLPLEYDYSKADSTTELVIVVVVFWSKTTALPPK